MKRFVYRDFVGRIVVVGCYGSRRVYAISPLEKCNVHYYMYFTCRYEGIQSMNIYRFMIRRHVARS